MARADPPADPPAAVKPLDPLEVVRDHYRALNRADLEAVMASYHPECETEGIFLHDHDPLDHARRRADAVHRGHPSNRVRFARLFGEYEGAFESGQRLQIRTLAMIETGWAHAEWRLRERRRSDAALVEHVGYSHFLLDAGLIRRQRTVAERASPERDERGAGGTATPSRRRYPDRPIVGVGAVVLVEDRVVLVKRRFEPLAGQWSLPGGSLEVGETLEAGAAREILEETGLEVEVGPVIEVFDRILLDEDKRIRYHFVLIDYLCRPVGGRLKAASDVADVALARPTDLGRFRLTPKATAIILRAVEMSRGAPPPAPPG